MIASILRPKMVAGDTPEKFVRRRNRLSSAEARRMGFWSLRYCKRVVSWRNHLLRPANCGSWASILLHLRGFEWLMARRAQNSGGLLGGRTGTRIASGNVATRWHDGVYYAAQQLACNCQWCLTQGLCSRWSSCTHERCHACSAQSRL